MKPISAFLCLAGMALAGQQPVSFQRTFKAGDADRYQTKLSLGVSLGDIDVHLKTQQKVLKVHESGEAEVETELLELKTLMNGAAVDAPMPKERKTTFRVNKSGMPVASPSKGGVGFSFLQFIGLLSDKPLTVGKSVDVAWNEPGGKTKVTGRVTLISAEAGVAKLLSSWEILDGSNAKPLKIDMTSFVEIASGKLNQASGTITGAQPSIEAQAIQFSLERERE